MTAIYGMQAPRDIMNYIKDASTKTGVDFSYLVHQAKAESNFDAQAKAKTSSATGLYQFIESTWLDMAEKYGHKYGLEGLDKQALLDKRKDPKIAALMAAELAQDNKTYLENKNIQNIGAVEMYFAHFMGAKGASEFLGARQIDGSVKAAYAFPKEAKANQGVFFNKDGSARSFDEVYAFFAKKFEGALTLKTETAEIAETANKIKRAVGAYVPHTSHVPYIKNAPKELAGFDPEVQRLILSPLFLEMETLNILRAEQSAGSFGSRLSMLDYSLFEE